MQFLAIKESTTLAQLADIVGDRNVDSILSANNLKRTRNIGKAFKKVCEEAIKSTRTITWEDQINLLNTVTDTFDVFEVLALSGQPGWKLYYSLRTFKNMLKIPEYIHLPDSVDVLGLGSGISDVIYKKAMIALKTPPHFIDPSIFNDYSAIKQSQIANSDDKSDNNPFQYQWFKIPWGEVSLYSSLSNEKMDFPVYPEELSDSRSANYTNMPDMLYQYEPWQVYQSSGPRSNTYSFHFHRDMWTGDHTDGKANQLIRFCEANCYPEYNGSAVYTSTVTLYIAGKAHITGILTDTQVRWSGPIGHDGWYLDCELELSITEVSRTPLSYSSVRNKGLIG